MKNMKKHNAYMASIPPKRNDPYAAAAAEVDNPGFLLATIKKLADLAQTRSMWSVTMDLTCCAIEMMTVDTPRFDVTRFGREISRASPRRADATIVSGRVSHKIAPTMRNIYDLMPEPKWVVSMGAYASSGGIFSNYAVVQGYDHIVPTDIYLPGCPPRPETLLNAILELTRQIGKRPLFKHREEIARAVEAAALSATPTREMKGLLA